MKVVSCLSRPLSTNRMIAYINDVEQRRWQHGDVGALPRKRQEKRENGFRGRCQKREVL
jgi:hypothetical protein